MIKYKSILPRINPIVKSNHNLMIQISRSITPLNLGDHINGAMVNETVTIQKFQQLVQDGYAYGAIVNGRNIKENFIARGEITVTKSGSLEDAQNESLYRQYGLLAYSLSDNTYRMVFRLSRQIKNSAEYVRYATALRFFLDGETTGQAVEVFFTNNVVETSVNGRTLPIGVLAQIAAREEVVEDFSAPNDPEELLRYALRQSYEGRRDTTVFGFSLNLRKMGIAFDKAKELVIRFQESVQDGITKYTQNEALDTLQQVYGHKAADDIHVIRIAAMLNRLDISPNVQKTLFGLLDAMESIGISKGANISMSQINKATGFHMAIMTISDHIVDLKEKGVLQVKTNGKGKSFSYSLMVDDNLRADIKSFTNLRNTQIEAFEFRELNKTTLCEIGSKIIPEFAQTESEWISRFGASAQRIISALAARPDGIDSQFELKEITGLSERCLRYTIASLVEQNIVISEKIGRSTKLTLAPDYANRIEQVEPALNNWGKSIHREEQSVYNAIEQCEVIIDCVSSAQDKLAAEEKVVLLNGRLDELSHKRQNANQKRLECAKVRGVNILHVPKLL